jgi:UDP-N-acetylglucosamine acyltransferase
LTGVRVTLTSIVTIRGIHPSSIIQSPIDDITVGPFCIIEEDVVVGPGTVLRAYIELRKGTRIGRDCYIDSGVKMSGDCVIGNNVTVRYDAIIARGCDVEDHTFISPQVMTINLTHTGEAIGGAHIGKRCHIGTAAVLHPGIRIADDVTIGAKALVTKDCDVAGVYVGIPATLRRTKLR